MNKGFGNLKADNIIERNENSVSLIFTIPQDSRYFDGHFPDNPILPAVAQVDIVINFASEYLGTGIAISQIKRAKFTKIITPSLTLFLKIDKKDSETLNFKITSQKPPPSAKRKGSLLDESEIYSSGSIIMENKHERKTE